MEQATVTRWMMCGRCGSHAIWMISTTGRLQRCSAPFATKCLTPSGRPTERGLAGQLKTTPGTVSDRAGAPVNAMSRLAYALSERTTERFWRRIKRLSSGASDPDSNERVSHEHRCVGDPYHRRQSPVSGLRGLTRHPVAREKRAGGCVSRLLFPLS